MEKILYDFLNNELDVPVYLEIPTSPGDTFVTIELTGRTENGKVETGVFAIQTHAKRRLQASTLADTVNNAMKDLLFIDSVSQVEKNSGFYNFTNLDTKEYRYQAVYEITFF